ncbi:MAG: hypothetical protein DSM106950_14780 [Stigonema ocellatum SAG 48.90 = DSM 106950]|nr:hypothetical protein [Stigonema ocellatum SAG 48.90 = DSM 106950]
MTPCLVICGFYLEVQDISYQVMDGDIMLMLKPRQQMHKCIESMESSVVRSA